MDPKRTKRSLNWIQIESVQLSTNSSIFNFFSENKKQVE